MHQNFRMRYISFDIINQLCEVMSGRSSDQGPGSMGPSSSTGRHIYDKNSRLVFSVKRLYLLHHNPKTFSNTDEGDGRYQPPEDQIPSCHDSIEAVT